MRRIIFPLLLFIALVSCSNGPNKHPNSAIVSAVTQSTNESGTATVASSPTSVPSPTNTLTQTVHPTNTPTPSPTTTLQLEPVRWDDPRLLEDINAVLDDHPDEIASLIVQSPGLGIGQSLVEDGKGKGYQNVTITLNGCAFVGAKEIWLGNQEKALISFFLFPLAGENDYILLPVLSAYQNGSKVGRIFISDLENLPLEQARNLSYEEAKAFLQEKESFTPARIGLEFNFNEQGEFDKNALAYNIRRDQDYLWAPTRFPNNQVLENAIKEYVKDDYVMAAGKLPDTYDEVDSWSFNLITKPILRSMSQNTPIGLIGNIDFN